MPKLLLTNKKNILLIYNSKKIVTGIGVSEPLQKEYTNLKVQNDSLVIFVKGGNFLSSNGTTAS
ncbi:MAG: hypothetical protein ABF274_12460 [Nonlabens sp.]|uniref:hypothetical protein n=1 Tax=Nonlabens sp. TaxID=1888209 RepID=UPI00321ADB21